MPNRRDCSCHLGKGITKAIRAPSIKHGRFAITQITKLPLKQVLRISESDSQDDDLDQLNTSDWKTDNTREALHRKGDAAVKRPSSTTESNP